MTNALHDGVLLGARHVCVRLSGVSVLSYGAVDGSAADWTTTSCLVQGDVRERRARMWMARRFRHCQDCVGDPAAVLVVPGSGIGETGGVAHYDSGLLGDYRVGVRVAAASDDVAVAAAIDDSGCFLDHRADLVAIPDAVYSVSQVYLALQNHQSRLDSGPILGLDPGLVLGPRGHTEIHPNTRSDFGSGIGMNTETEEDHPLQMRHHPHHRYRQRYRCYRRIGSHYHHQCSRFLRLEQVSMVPPSRVTLEEHSDFHHHRRTQVQLPVQNQRLWFLPAHRSLKAHMLIASDSAGVIVEQIHCPHRSSLVVRRSRVYRYHHSHTLLRPRHCCHSHMYSRQERMYRHYMLIHNRLIESMDLVLKILDVPGKSNE